MNVTCAECNSVFRVDPAKIPQMGIRARCSVCGGVIAIGAHGAIDDDFVAPAIPRAASATPARAGLAAPGAPVKPPAATTPPPQAAALAPAVQSPAPRPQPTLPTPPMLARTPTVATPASTRVVPPAAPSAPATSPRAPAAPASPSAPSSASAVRPTPVRPTAVRPTPVQPPPKQVPAAPVTPPRPQMRPPQPGARPATPIAGAPSIPTRAATPATAGTPATRPPINPFLANDPNQKAKRLARALISDIVTYFPDKHRDGLQNGTLRELFREEIKKSYEEYVEQMGKEFASSTTHFQDALNEVLAKGKKVF